MKGESDSKADHRRQARAETRELARLRDEVVSDHREKRPCSECLSNCSGYRHECAHQCAYPRRCSRDAHDDGPHAKDAPCWVVGVFRQFGRRGHAFRQIGDDDGNQERQAEPPTCLTFRRSLNAFARNFPELCGGRIRVRAVLPDR